MKSGYWPLYRFHPSEIEDGQPFKLDSHKPSIPVREFVGDETRFAILERTHPERAAELAALAQADVDERWRYYEQLAGDAPHGPPRPAPTSTGVDATRATATTTRRREMADLTTTYLGLELRSPIVASASPLNRRRREVAATARGRRRGRDRAAVVVRGGDPARGARSSTARSRPAPSTSPRRSTTSRPSTDVRRRRRALPRPTSNASRPRSAIPVIASLNATRTGGWVRYARLHRRTPAPTRSS